MITQATLKELLNYNPETGNFIWVSSPANCIKVGDKAGSKDSYGYYKIAIQRKTYKAHRLAWIYVHGDIPNQPIDHINGDRADNRIQNLRVVTPKENQQNQKKFTNNTSGATGVHWHVQHKRWQARIFVDGKRVDLGAFDDVVSAVAARKSAERKYNYHPNHGRGA